MGYNLSKMKETYVDYHGRIGQFMDQVEDISVCPDGSVRGYAS